MDGITPSKPLKGLFLCPPSFSRLAECCCRIGSAHNTSRNGASPFTEAYPVPAGRSTGISAPEKRIKRSPLPDFLAAHWRIATVGAVIFFRWAVEFSGTRHLPFLKNCFCFLKSWGGTCIMQGYDFFYAKKVYQAPSALA